jgi:hypothetical protein
VRPLEHSDVGITLAVYDHLAPDTQDEAANSLDGLIFGGDDSEQAATAMG